MARNGANNNKNQNQFDINDNTCVPDAKIIKSLTFLKEKNSRKNKKKLFSFSFSMISTYSAIPPSIFKSLPQSNSEPVSEYFAFDINAIN